MPAEAVWYRAFGLEIESRLAVPGLPRVPGSVAGPRVALDLVDPGEVERAWAPASGAERILVSSESPARTIDREPRLGYRLWADGHGTAWVAPDGARVRWAPPPGAADAGHGFLLGHVLPWAAVLRGREALHASAVELDGHAIALAGPSGAGKTSVAVALAASGAGWVTDDVLALDSAAMRVRAHPGPALARLRQATPGSPKEVVDMEAVTAPVALGAIGFLTRGEGPAVVELERPDPRRLLASTFVRGVRTPERLRTQLDICAAISREATLLEVRVGHRTTPAELADALHDRFGGKVGAR
jgi:hypothetical protein